MKPRPRSRLRASTKLPRGWATSRIGDVVDEHIEQGLPDHAKEFVYVEISALDNHHKEIVAPRKMQVTEAPSRARQRIKAGDVLVSKTRPSLNAVAIVPPAVDGAIASTGFAVLRPIEVLPHWLLTVVQSEDFVFTLSCAARGSLYPAVRSCDVLDYVMPLPPLGEQKRIVDRMAQLLARERHARQLLEPLPTLIQEYRAAVLQAAYDGRLVPTEATQARNEGRNYEHASVLLERILNQRSSKGETERLTKVRATGRQPANNERKRQAPEPAQPSLEGAARLPEGWVWCSFDQAFDVERGRFSIRPRNDPAYYGGRFPFVQIGDLPANGGVITKIAQTLNEHGVAVSKMFPKGTVLIAIVGSTIGNTGVLGFDSCCPDSLVAFQSDDSTRLRFLDYYLRLRKADVRRAAISSSGQPNINLGILHPWPMPLAPLAEQKRIVAEVKRRFAALSRLEVTVMAAMEQTAQLRSSFVRRALAGKLVPQSTRDEPAARLLEEIRTLKAVREELHEAGRPHRVREKAEDVTMLGIEDIKPRHLAEILMDHRKPMDARDLWKASRLTIDDFYAQLKKEMGKGIRKTKGKEPLLETKP